MKMEMDEKARDIMSRKEDTAYLGRNLFLEGEKYLKEMKVSNPVSKVNSKKTDKNRASRGLKKTVEEEKRSGHPKFSNQVIRNNFFDGGPTFKATKNTNYEHESITHELEDINQQIK